MPKKTARRIIDTRKDSGTTIITGVTVSGSPGSGASAAMAGDGLTYSSGVLNVGAGTGITVAADSVSLASTVAGAGLTHSAGVLAVGAGNGITVNADDVALTTPGTLTAATSNSSTGNHTHAVTTGAASTLTVATTNATGSSASLARADHLHTITSSADVTGGGTSLLASSAGNLKLATGNIGSTLGYNGTFTSGFAGAGWQVDYGVTEAAKASATFDNLTVRGRMRVYELLIQQIRATNGSVLVSSSSKILTVSAESDPTWTVNGATLQFNGVDATLTTTIYTIATSTSAEDADPDNRRHYHGFLVGDLIRAQQMEWDGSGFAGVIQSDLEVTAVANLYSYTAARVSTASDAPAVGYDFVRIGSASNANRQGVVYLTSDDDNAPFIDIVDGVASHAQWNTAGKIRARLGRLDGITDAQWGTLSGYGLWSDNVYLTGNIYATDGIFNGTVYASAGSFSGTVTASSGTIGGWSIGATALTAGSGANTVGVDSGGSNPAFYAGSATPGSAPFQVTQAGALTATNATITGAITASSGSLSGFLTIGSSGGIYQGTGTAGTPTTGLKIWNDGGVGRIGGYNGGTLQWYASTNGYFYGGDGTNSRFRLGNESFRSVINTGSNTYGFWFLEGADLDATGTLSSSAVTDMWASIYSYKITTSGSEQGGFLIGNRINSSLYTTYDSLLDLSAQSSNGVTTRFSKLQLVALKNGGARYMTYSGDYFYLDGYMWFKPVTAPGTPATGVVLYCDSSDGKLKSKNTSGTTQNLSA